MDKNKTAKRRRRDADLEKFKTDIKSDSGAKYLFQCACILPTDGQYIKVYTMLVLIVMLIVSLVWTHVLFCMCVYVLLALQER